MHQLENNRKCHFQYPYKAALVTGGIFSAEVILFSFVLFVFVCQVPSKPSNYVNGVTKSLETTSGDFPVDQRKQWNTRVIDAVTMRYIPT